MSTKQRGVNKAPPPSGDNIIISQHEENMKSKIKIVEWVILIIIAVNLLTQDWSNVTVLDYCVLATSAILIIVMLIVIPKRKKEE